jgi:hypothetical protein
MIQLGILIISCITITLLTCKNKKLRKWGCVTGLVGQPLWLYSTWTAEPFLWGMFIVSCWFTYRYIAGAANNFYKVK